MILFLFLFGLVLGAESPSDSQEVPLERGICPMFWYSFNNSCYKYVSTHMTWVDAEIYCVSEGAHLVSIHSLEEQNFVSTLIMNFDPGMGRTWIGLSDIHKDGWWMWSDGSQVDFTFWHSGEPNNLGGNEVYAHTFYSEEQTWNDYPYDRTLSFVCATRTVC